MMSLVRLFVSVDPSLEAREDLDSFLEARRDAGGGLRWTPPGQWHLTVAFMAAAPARVVDDLADRVAAAVARSPAFDVFLGAGGCFPDVTRARVLWVGVPGAAALPRLARAVRSACAVAGGAPEGGAFRAHVTLARMPRPADATRWVRILDTYAGPSWTVTDVALVASHLPSGKGARPRHEVLARLPLGGRAGPTAAGHSAAEAIPD